MEHTVVCKNLAKNYRGINAIEEFNIKLDGGKVIGLIGRNGAGKTTLLKMIAGLLNPSSGSVDVMGMKPMNNLDVLSQIFFSREDKIFDEDRTVKEILHVASIYYELWDHQMEQELARKFRLDRNKKVKKLSKGMQRALTIIVALSCKAPITLFDEPTEGLDAASRKLFYQLILKEASDQSRLIIISSHLLSEIEAILEEIVLIDEGTLLLHESVENMREYAVELEGHKDELSPIIDNTTIISETVLGNKKRVIIKSDEALLDKAKRSGKSIAINPVTPQDLSIHLTEKWGNF